MFSVTSQIPTKHKIIQMTHHNLHVTFNQKEEVFAELITSLETKFFFYPFMLVLVRDSKTKQQHTPINMISF